MSPMKKKSVVKCEVGARVNDFFFLSPPPVPASGERLAPSASHRWEAVHAVPALPLACGFNTLRQYACISLQE